MIDLSFAGSETALLKGARTLLVVAPEATFKKLPAILDAKLRKLCAELGNASPGDNGATAGSLTGAAPRRIVAGVLPDTVSRYNSPMRAEAARNVMRQVGADAKGKTAVLLILDDPDHYRALANAVARALPLYSRKGEARKKPPARKVQLFAVDREGKPVRASADVKVTADSTREAARLVDTAPTDMNPAALARSAKALLRGIRGVRISEVVGNALLEKRLGGIHGVGRCAVEKPRMLVASYTPARGKGEHVALVGKGVTYDTGGLNIKTGGFMSGMKGDMGGAAAVLGAFRALASTGCKHRVSLVLCIAENAIGPVAYKPDDILTLHSGKTVEINNTDAEGRLLLGDGVSWAARRLKADYIFDAATLTGAQLIATGRLHAAIFSNDAELEALTVAAGTASGDLVHPLMFCPEFFRKEFASEVADMKNSVKNRKNAQSAAAAQFVYNHIDDVDVKWCHIDLAGPAELGERGTGFGVALLSEAVRRI